MDLDIRQHLPQEFSPQSKVWIYQSNRLFLISEALELEEMLNSFVEQWKSHGDPVTGFANLFFGRFIILMADDSSQVSGCSTDSSVHLVKKIEQQFNVDLFNREQLAFILKDKVEVIPVQQLPYAIENNFINRNTLYFNNAITTKWELEKNWIIPAGESWISRYFSKDNTFIEGENH